MLSEIQTITLPLPFRLGTVNCYLVRTNTGFALIDTGAANKRDELEDKLRSAGCEPGDLALIALTHGDFDHTGNAAYLRDTFGAKIAMHKHDVGMAEKGDMFWNRSSGNAVLGAISPILFRFSKSNRFTPDIYLEANADLAEYGFDAQVLSLPGHSLGSTGYLTASGDLFCGDLLENYGEPAMNSIMDDPVAAKASIEYLRSIEVTTVYPGHGQPFALDSLTIDE
jgi:glyoxylase-like metal-dependent hydrolase (beta-lactamase superfamily II)